MDGNVFNFESLPLITQIRMTSFTGELGGRVCINNGKIVPQQQKGPTCGLVALSMCLEHFGVKVSLDSILEKAKELRLTKQGEMYSADSLATLANNFLPSSSMVRKMPNAKEYTQAILDGKYFIIAYDCGPNYQPSHVKGHSAHWLLACGFVKKYEETGFVETKESEADASEIAIIGYQGKSTTLNVFPFTEVVSSNAQLLEAGEKRNPNEYIIPDPNNLSEIRDNVVEVYMNI